MFKSYQRSWHQCHKDILSHDMLDEQDGTISRKYCEEATGS